MKSRKERHAELKAQRNEKHVRRAGKLDLVQVSPKPLVPVNPEALAPNNSIGAPDFLRRGYYEDEPFNCEACGKKQTWTATQQKWWYEIAKGELFTTAVLCRPCRRKEQARRAEARRIHLEGLALKKSKRLGN